ncbi:aldose 1-epimerase family protein [Flavilitoribacter nigricans]|uniref:Aldose epimerase n=1 Tax=Flavilitoribacter nigricans (strain ATCC 23147 / DSM 23189 / NBRC 102662 / NCIMB 1420 / SS-2) TaxID=1122177 RepID=A0A2D0N4B3_FLAN2|nr:aldose 1-epimerase family protein [Flavilitoribacter nigricans]PHN03392.1 aldose epimerase [Flavilitoribacter nigricans DSM 23189 = NBRC 102662]
MQPIQIENQQFTATIDLHGAQLASLLRKESSEEFIWQRDPAYWAESAPICFPIVGDLKDGTYHYEGKTYRMKKHGVVRYADFSLKDRQTDACTLSVKADADTLASYPFQFALEINFRLTDEGIVVAYTIRNEGNKDMPTGLGYHPAFNIDIENFEHSDYEIKFSEKETLDLYWLQQGVLELKTEKYLQNEDSITLTPHIFNDDALIFKDIKSQKISLNRKGTDWQLDMYTGGAPHLGIWAKPAAPYVCIEPWYTYQDSADVSGDLFEKPGMFVLKPGETFESHYELRV